MVFIVYARRPLHTHTHTGSPSWSRCRRTWRCATRCGTARSSGPSSPPTGSRCAPHVLRHTPRTPVCINTCIPHACARVTMPTQGAPCVLRHTRPVRPMRPMRPTPCGVWRAELAADWLMVCPHAPPRTPVRRPRGLACCAQPSACLSLCSAPLARHSSPPRRHACSLTPTHHPPPTTTHRLPIPLPDPAPNQHACSLLTTHHPPTRRPPGAQNPLAEVDAAALEETVARFNKAVYKMERGLVPNKARDF
jgi:hypothetical protein